MKKTLWTLIGLIYMCSAAAKAEQIGVAEIGFQSCPAGAFFERCNYYRLTPLNTPLCDLLSAPWSSCLMVSAEFDGGTGGTWGPTETGVSGATIYVAGGCAPGSASLKVTPIGPEGEADYSAQEIYYLNGCEPPPIQYPICYPEDWSCWCQDAYGRGDWDYIFQNFTTCISVFYGS